MTAFLWESLPEKIHVQWIHSKREIYIDGHRLYDTYSQKIRNHSPDGFNVGYNGSGPSQLALAILLKFLPKEDACNYYQEFKFSVVGKWPQKDFEMFIDFRKIILNIVQERIKDPIR